MRNIILNIAFILVSISIVNAQEFNLQSNELDINAHFGNLIFDGGGGISCADFNQDGYDDLSFCSEELSEIYFYKNEGNKFTPVTFSGISVNCESKQVLWIDYDNDGDKDLFVTCYGDLNHLFENDGNFNFTDVTTSKGMFFSFDLTFGANFADTDYDGYLDLYICNYGTSTTADTNTYFRYDPIVNQYIDKTYTAGISNGQKQSFCTVFFDYDKDDDLDFYLANDRNPYPNALYSNNGDGTFTDVAVASNTDLAVLAMNTGLGDFDRNGYFDIYVTNSTVASLFQNNGNGTFTDVASSSGTIFNRFGWGGNFLDIDNDRDEDLYVSHRFATSTSPGALYVNNNDGTFSEPFFTSGGIGNVDILPTFANAIGDFNNDGKPDIVKSLYNASTFEIYINNQNTNNHFIKLDLRGVDSNIDAYGAYVECWINGDKTIFQKHAAVGYLSQPSDYLNIGVGNYTQIDSLIVKWPYPNSKSIIHGSNIKVDQLNIITENSSSVVNMKLPICLNAHEVNFNPIPSQEYYGASFLNAETIVQDGSDVLFRSQNEINLEDDFEVKIGATFKAEIEDCGN